MNWAKVQECKNCKIVISVDDSDTEVFSPKCGVKHAWVQKKVEPQRPVCEQCSSVVDDIVAHQVWHTWIINQLNGLRPR